MTKQLRAALDHANQTAAFCVETNQDAKALPKPKCAPGKGLHQKLVHYFTDPGIACSDRPTITGIRRSVRWEEVDCPKCLALRHKL